MTSVNNLFLHPYAAQRAIFKQ